MLSNITIDGRPGLQTILLGQPQFRRILANPDLEQLRQRILASYHLGPMSVAETHAYVEHRLKRVGWAGTPAWEDGALDAMHRGSDGIPRRINTLGSRVLLLAALEEAQVITARMVDATATELAGDLGGGVSGGFATPMAAVPGSADPELVRRVELLEQTTARQERVFRRLLDLMGSMMETPK